MCLSATNVDQTADLILVILEKRLTNKKMQKENLAGGALVKHKGKG